MAIKPTKPGAGFAWRFHYGLRTLKRAYESSRMVADKEKEAIEERYARHKAEVEAGEASWVDYDEDGYPGPDYGEHLGERLDEEEAVLNLVRLAFVMSLHHFFEQQLVGHLPPNKKGQRLYDQSEAFKWLKKFGWQPKETELNELQLAANCAKHSAGTSATKLFALRPDMFDQRRIQMGYVPEYDSLAITDAHVAAFFQALKESVPSNLGISF